MIVSYNNNFLLDSNSMLQPPIPSNNSILLCFVQFTICEYFIPANSFAIEFHRFRHKPSPQWLPGAVLFCSNKTAEILYIVIRLKWFDTAAHLNECEQRYRYQLDRCIKFLAVASSNYTLLNIDYMRTWIYNTRVNTSQRRISCQTNVFL